MDREIVNASKEDLGLAQSYSLFTTKGKEHKGQRITVMTRKSHYKVGEEVRIIHILEATSPQVEVYVMGPKTIYEEYVDGKLITAHWPKGGEIYDGAVAKGPHIDFNYTITKYRFKKPGKHTIIWKGGGHPVQEPLGLVSNTLTVNISK